MMKKTMNMLIIAIILLGGFVTVISDSTIASEWSVEVIENVAVSDTSIAVDEDNYPHIGYNSGGLKYAKWNGNTWIIETVDNSSISYSSMALDSRGYAYFSYNARKNLTYASVAPTL